MEASLTRTPAPGSGPTAVDRRLTLARATPADREAIFRLRHAVYAAELGQHPVNPAQALHDALDAYNEYLVAWAGESIAGFVSLTPPGQPAYSIDKYFSRDALPFAVDPGLHEVRLLTVLPAHRGSRAAFLLMYGALRWAEAHGGTQVVAIGRREILPLYEKCGLRRLGLTCRSGAVSYELLHATIAELRTALETSPHLLNRLRDGIAWHLDIPFDRPAPCFHGGAFFDAVGPRFDSLDRRAGVINADVLDAWFPPAPGLLDTLHQHLAWLLQTSPPTDCSGLLETIARVRRVAVPNLLPGNGSSDLIYRAFLSWLTPASRVLILDPTYGEYAHVLQRVIRCRVERLVLDPDADFDVDPRRLRDALQSGYDLVVVVNPNSPTGRHLPGPLLADLLRDLPARTRVWVDETYVDYAGSGASLEQFAARESRQVLVCKSLSKVLGLSGARVAYLCGSPHQLEPLRAITPPWVVSLPAQVAAVKALEDEAYYQARYRDTATLREDLAHELQRLGWRVVPGCANFLLCRLPDAGPNAAALVQACRDRGLFLRNAAGMGSLPGDRWVRVAVKDADTNTQIVGILRACLQWPRSDLRDDR